MPHAQTPPPGSRLTWIPALALVISLITQSSQASDPPLPDTNTDTDTWWSLRPLASPGVPVAAATLHSGWQRTPVDAFIARSHQRLGLTPSNPASRRTLVRRATIDLHGLPPTPDQVTAFLEDSSPDAYSRLVERLLHSPRYGERWARHWLDIVHYGDTHGYDKDKPRPNAWPYRDYVVRAFNDDKTLDRFVLEQVAGDVLFPNTTDGIVATGLLAAGPWDFIGHAEVPETKLDGQVARNLDRDDMVRTVINSFTSLTVQCARCHDHKFDDVSMHDYYSLQAVFAAIDRADRPYPAHSTTPGPGPALVYAGTVHTGNGSFRGTGHDNGRPRPIRLLARGDIQRKGQLIEPGTVPLAAGLASRFALPTDHSEGDRRAALARWLIDRRNPLTWRSFANRLWQYHIGQPLVTTPNDFGRMGEEPSHPQLLDWLAARLRDGNGSIKDIHRQILQSATYRQSSKDRPDATRLDAGNRFLWRMNRRRVEAEVIRDSVLSVAGRLDNRMYGPGFQNFVIEKPQHSPHYLYRKHDHNDPRTHRRSVYRFLVRSQQQPFMTVLDCADPSRMVPQRDETISALQALAMLNNRFMTTMSEHFARRLTGETPRRIDQLRHAVQLALSRDADDLELQLLSDYATRHGLPATCRIILNLNEFVFVE
jgi:hypothetical protein